MRSLLAACAALALAGGVAQASEPFAPPTWTGPYLGAHVGYAWGDASVTDTTGGVTPGPFTYSPKGAFGGGTAGYNVQLGFLVIGAEADIGYMGLNGKGLIPSSNPAAHQDITLDGGLYVDATARLGFAYQRTLFYAKGGWAYFDGTAGQKTTNPGYITNPTGAFSGRVFGGGIEHKLSATMSLKVEYLHFNFGSEGGDQTSVSDPPVGFRYENKTDLSADTIKLGIAVHF